MIVNFSTLQSAKSSARLKRTCCESRLSHTHVNSRIVPNHVHHVPINMSKVLSIIDETETKPLERSFLDTLSNFPSERKNAAGMYLLANSFP